MTRQLIDPHAVNIPQQSGLPPCLFIPVAARDTKAVETYVGRVISQSGDHATKRALLIEAHEPEQPDPRLPIWKLPRSTILHARQQVWVNVDYGDYRHAYIQALPDPDLTDLVLDHVMNRRVARLKGFAYLRLVPISRPANSSHGGLSEDWAVKYHSTPRMMEINRTSQASVQYADLADIVKMLNMTGGGSLMDNVNETQKLIKPPEGT